MFFGFFSSKKTKLEEFKTCYDLIKQTVAKKDNKEVLNNQLKFFHKTIKESRTTPDQYTSAIYDYIISNDIISQLIDYCIKYQETQLILIDDVTMILHEVKWISKIISNTASLCDKLIQLIVSLEKKMKVEQHRFVFRNSFAFLLNEITRLLLNYPNLIMAFKQDNNDFIIFSNLLYLLQIDEMISSYEVRKYIRRSLIVSLSFDEIASSSYLECCNIPEMLVNKLCNYYQLLPKSFDIANSDSSIEIGCNINKSFPILNEFYIEFKDYVAFFNKITNAIRSHRLKTRLKYYLFNKFCIGNVQTRLLNKNQKVYRTNLQYIGSLLHDVQNSDIIDVIVSFLFGFNEQKIAMNYDDYIINTNVINAHNEGIVNHDYVASSLFDGSRDNDNGNLGLVYHHQSDFDISASYDYTNHLVTRIASKVLRSLNNKTECINIVSIELFETLMEKRPYLMIHKFVKPYVDLCLKKNNSNGEPMGYCLSKKAYPSIKGLLNMISLYEKYDTSNMKANIEFNMQRNYSYYMNYDIDFYYYYIDTKQAMNDLEDKSMNENSLEIDDDANLLEGCLNFEMEINTNENANVNHSASKENSKNQTGSCQRKGTEVSNMEESNEENNRDSHNNNTNTSNSNNFNRHEIEVDFIIFNHIEEIKEEMQNINFLLMKNIHSKLCNYLNNTNYENIFLTNFVLTMISIPCLQFDSDLVECNAFLFEDNIHSKYSLLTVIRYISQEISKKIKQCITFDAFFKRCLLEMNIEQASFSSFDNSQSSKDKEKPNANLSTRKGQPMKSALKSFKQGVMTAFEPHLESEYQKKKKDLVNYIVFFEFLKEFITTFSHKHRFENLVEDIYELYSNELDNYYYNDINKEITR